MPQLLPCSWANLDHSACLYRAQIHIRSAPALCSWTDRKRDALPSLRWSCLKAARRSAVGGESTLSPTPDWTSTRWEAFSFSGHAGGTAEEAPVFKSFKCTTRMTSSQVAGLSRGSSTESSLKRTKRKAPLPPTTSSAAVQEMFPVKENSQGLSVYMCTFPDNSGELLSHFIMSVSSETSRLVFLWVFCPLAVIMKHCLVLQTNSFLRKPCILNVKFQAAFVNSKIITPLWYVFL